MPITEVPNSPPPAQNPESQQGPAGVENPQLPPPRNNSDYGDLGTDELAQRISELEDERRAARIREGIWIALLLHSAVLLLWAFGPRYILHEPRIVSPADALKDRKDLSYLDLPPDALKQLKPKNPKVLSDKDRVQSSEHPTLDKKTLDELRAMKRAGPPTPQPPEQPQQQPAQSAPAPPSQQAPAQPPAPQQAQQSPAAPTPLQTLPRQPAKPSQSANNPFKVPDSAGDIIRQAARDAARGGASGDYGQNAPLNHGGVSAGYDILSDTQGVDFGPYMQRVIQATYNAWTPLIPQSARPPLDNKGKVGIEFKIAPDGSVKEMVLKYPSGDVSLDRAAWGGIKFASYPPLPKDFKGSYLALRFGFYYNIKPEDEK
jgi:outer membrane biosynthesis protein TonB